MITAPPGQILELFVISGIATLRQRQVADPSMMAHERDNLEEPHLELDVPAKTLLIALQALVAEDDTPKPPQINN